MINNNTKKAGGTCLRLFLYTYTIQFFYAKMQVKLYGGYINWLLLHKFIYQTDIAP